MFNNYCHTEDDMSTLKSLGYFYGGFYIFTRSPVFHKGLENDKHEKAKAFYTAIKNGSDFKSARIESSLSFTDATYYLSILNKIFKERNGNTFFTEKIKNRKPRKRTISILDDTKFLSYLDSL